MGDYAYARFSLPVHRLTAEHREHVCQVFGLDPHYLDDLLRHPPLPQEAGNNNDTALRLVQGCPCLVIEDDNCNYAGSAEESELENSSIPFLRINEGGDEYGPSQSIYDGKESMTIRLDGGGKAIVGLCIQPDGTVEVDEDEIADVRRFIGIANRLLTTT